jgi:putative methyltransferase (TIGR04325 family)
MIATDWLPRLLRRDRAHVQPSGFHGDYASWEDARRASQGYDDGAILEKTRVASAAARDDESVFERDSVLLPRPERPYPLLACLLAAALKAGGRLSVLDFGGSLGSTYFQCRPFLSGIDHLRWAVVEQPHYVVVGRREFTSEVLGFHDTPEAACVAVTPDVLLLSGVLAYLSDPYEMLERLLGLRIPSIVVDRTPFLRSDRDRLTVQVVPPEIYPASYPAWFFGQTRLLSTFDRAGYRVAEEWPCVDDYSPDGDRAAYKGFLFVGRESKAS